MKMLPQKEELTLGQKIRNFRKREGLSQLDLEVRINASPGSLSRIESGQINPTKETLLRIIEALELSPIDASSLFKVDIFKEINKVIDISKDVDLENINLTINTIVDKIGKFLHTTTVAIFLWNEEKEELRCQRIIAPSLALVWAEKIMGFSATNYIIDAKNPKFALNDYLKTIKSQEIVETRDVYNLGYPYFDRRISNFLQLLINMKLEINLPLTFNEKKLGVFGVLWSNDYISSEEKILLQSYADQIAIAIYNAQKYDELNKKYLELKNKHAG